MKLTNSQLYKIIKEEMQYIIENDSDLAKALKAKAGVQKDPNFSFRTTQIGSVGPSKEYLIQAAMVLDINPDSFSNQMIIYNVGMLLQNRPEASPDDIARAAEEAKEEAELVGGDRTLEESAYDERDPQQKHALGPGGWERFAYTEKSYGLKDELIKILKRWETTKYESDKERWQEYAADIEDLLSEPMRLGTPEEDPMGRGSKTSSLRRKAMNK